MVRLLQEGLHLSKLSVTDFLRSGAETASMGLSPERIIDFPLKPSGYCKRMDLMAGNSGENIFLRCEAEGSIVCVNCP